MVKLATGSDRNPTVCIAPRIFSNNEISLDLTTSLSVANSENMKFSSDIGYALRTNISRMKRAGVRKVMKLTEKLHHINKLDAKRYAIIGINRFFHKRFIKRNILSMTSCLLTRYKNTYHKIIMSIALQLLCVVYGLQQMVKAGRRIN
jgi:hypothetical protein